MKILLLMGSFRKNGNTAQITSLIATQLKAITEERTVPLEMETVELGHQNIGLCRGCRACFDLGEDKCPLKDDLLPIKEKIRWADGVIIASPIYVDDINGITKNWIDRMAHVCHRPEFAGKTAYLVTTVGSSPSNHSLQSLFLAFLTWGFFISGKSGFKTGAKMEASEINTRFTKQAEKIARKIINDIQRNKGASPSFVSLMMFKIYQQVWRTKGDTLDSRYWHGNGWTNPKVEFYIPHRSNPLIVFLARLTGGMIARFVS
jgi:multimeric flavodoxin WrbA